MNYKVPAQRLADCLKHADAEALLLAGYHGMIKSLDNTSQKYKVGLMEGLERLVQLCEPTGKKDKADEWRKKQRTPGKQHSSRDGYGGISSDAQSATLPPRHNGTFNLART